MQSNKHLLGLESANLFNVPEKEEEGLFSSINNFYFFQICLNKSNLPHVFWPLLDIMYMHYESSLRGC